MPSGLVSRRSSRIWRRGSAHAVDQHPAGCRRHGPALTVTLRSVGPANRGDPSRGAASRNRTARRVPPARPRRDRATTRARPPGQNLGTTPRAWRSILIVWRAAKTKPRTFTATLCAAVLRSPQQQAGLSPAAHRGCHPSIQHQPAAAIAAFPREVEPGFRLRPGGICNSSVSAVLQGGLRRQRSWPQPSRPTYQSRLRS